jgi:hypothetical protein
MMTALHLSKYDFSIFFGVQYLPVDATLSKGFHDVNMYVEKVNLLLLPGPRWVYRRISPKKVYSLQKRPKKFHKTSKKLCNQVKKIIFLENWLENITGTWQQRTERLGFA